MENTKILENFLESEYLLEREENKKEAIEYLSKRSEKNLVESDFDIYMKIMKQLTKGEGYCHLYYHNTFLFKKEETDSNSDFQWYYLICTHFEDGGISDIKRLLKAMKYIKHLFKCRSRLVEVYINYLNMNGEKLIIEISYWK